MATANNKPAAKQDAKAEAKAVTLKALTRIEHDGQVYEPGEEIADVADKAARALIDCGAAEDVAAKAAAADAAAKTEEQA